jgi:hypothetical protein
MLNTKIFVYISFITLIVITMSSCTKEVPKDLQTQNQTQQKTQIDPSKQMPNDSIHRNLKPDSEQTTQNDTSKGDPKAEKMTKEADDADAKFQKSKSDADKKTAIEKQLAAANYLMFGADLSPKKKYRPALKRYNRVLELDPTNEEAKQNKLQIEDIYKSMGVPVPN